MLKLLVLCTGNSCRSQIAEGYLRHFGKGDLEVYSAGIETHGVNPRAIQVMKEDGVDISRHTSNHVDEYGDIKFDWVITVCDNAKENCPYFPGDVKRLYHNFPDPAKATGNEEQILNSFRSTRDLIKEYSRDLVAKTLK
ncbi:MAG: arsenate reductase ArsC [Cyclobacteriaceae bacterium]